MLGPVVTLLCMRLLVLQRVLRISVPLVLVSVVWTVVRHLGRAAGRWLSTRVSLGRC